MLREKNDVYKLWVELSQDPGRLTTLSRRILEIDFVQAVGYHFV
jgi:hypothetical protein